MTPFGFKDLALIDPDAIHVVIRDQTGFQLLDRNARLPEHVRIISLPPYNPGLNPCKQLWDISRDEIGNRVFEAAGNDSTGLATLLG